MQSVIRPSLARAAAILLPGPYLLLASALAPEHIHEPGPHDHDHAIAHSHFGPHTAAAHPIDPTEIEHDDDHVIWLDSSILNEHLFQASPVPLAVVSVIADLTV